MRKYLLGAAILASIAMPALAQVYDGSRYGDDRDRYSDSRDVDGDGDVDSRDLNLRGVYGDQNRGYGDRDRAYGDRDRAYGDRDERDRGGYDRDGRYGGYDQRRGDGRDVRGGYGNVQAGLRPGQILPLWARHSSWLLNPWKLRLPAAPRNTHWIAVRHSAVLVRNGDKMILRVLRDRI